MRLAFLGTGKLGSAMVRRLLARGFAVCVWNRSPDKLEALVSAGANASASPRDAASAAEVVALCLTDAAAVENVIFGPGGVAGISRRVNLPPRLLVDFSTIGPEASQALAKRLSLAADFRWLDSPVSGGVRGAELGELILFCGGEPDDLARAKPVLDALARRITHVGAVGAGQAVKLCNQMIVATTLLAITEALALGRGYGLDITRLPGTLADGFADSSLLRLFGPRMAVGQTEPRTGDIGTMRKDVESIEAMARSANVSAPLLDAVLKIYRSYRTAGLEGQDLTALGKRTRSVGEP